MRQERKPGETAGRNGSNSRLNHSWMTAGLLKLFGVNESSRISRMVSKIIVTAGFLGSKVYKIKNKRPVYSFISILQHKEGL